MENKVVKAKDLAVDDVVVIYKCRWNVYCINKLENGDVQVDYTYNCDYKMQRVYLPNAEIKVFRN
jgi:hypothetical protein